MDIKNSGSEEYIRAVERGDQSHLSRMTDEQFKKWKKDSLFRTEPNEKEKTS